MKLKVELHDPRGSKEVPYGFINFNDDTRVVYNGEDVWEGNWGTVTEKHFQLAREYLAEKGVKGYESKSSE